VDKIEEPISGQSSMLIRYIWAVVNWDLFKGSHKIGYDPLK